MSYESSYISPITKEIKKSMPSYESCYITPIAKKTKKNASRQMKKMNALV